MFSHRFIAAVSLGLLAFFAAPQAAWALEPAARPVADYSEAALTAALDELAAVKAGDARTWREKRAAVLAFGSDALAALEHAAKDEHWTRDRYTRALAAEICRLRISQPELAQSVDQPRGIDPEVYRQFRHGKPSCHRDFAHAGTSIVPLLLEALVFTLPERKFSGGEAGQLERETLLAALVQVPGEKSDSRARFVLEDVLKSGSHSDGLRALAAVSYAQCAGAEGLTLLDDVVGSAATPLKVREGAAMALGWMADVKALASIRSRLESAGLGGEGEEAVALRRALIVALGTLGNSGGWQARGAEKAEIAREIRAGSATLLVACLRNFPADVEFISSALCVVAWKDSLGEVRKLAEDASGAEAVHKAARQVLPLLEMAVARER